MAMTIDDLVAELAADKDLINRIILKLALVCYDGYGRLEINVQNHKPHTLMAGTTDSLKKGQLQSLPQVRQMRDVS